MRDLEIDLSPERMDEGTAEERATFGLFTIKTQDTSLTEGFDYFLNGNRLGPLVSGYHAAQWFTWNWWRLINEPRSSSPDWKLVHSMASIGEGYVWPNITIFSDGERTAIISNRSERPDAKPFRYVGGTWAVLPTEQFVDSLDSFVPRMLAQLGVKGLSGTNLETLWSDVCEERADKSLSKIRRLEALLGQDPSDVPEFEIAKLLEDSEILGDAAAAEVAADCGQARDVTNIPVLCDLREIARSIGFESHSHSAVRLTESFAERRRSETPAWKVGTFLARALRDQELLGFEPLPDGQLAEMAGTSKAVLTSRPAHESTFSFSLDSDRAHSQIVLRSKWVTSRRFDLARLIGDRFIEADGLLHPATRAYTYRQKAQRAFAAELLSPFEAVQAMLAEDYSQEQQHEVAEYFQVSPLTIDTMLRNHGRLPRDTIEQPWSADY